MARRVKGPGVVKASAFEIGATRRVELWQSADYRLRELFEGADVMSEGATRVESEGAVYYGSTSVLLPSTQHGGQIPKERAYQIARLVASDPHARVRAIRIACLEAQIRCKAPLGRVRAELFVRIESRGIRVDVDVEARVFDERRDTGTAPATKVQARRATRPP
ncbi:MAG TPA: hypothetical protein VGI10_24910 [Polyangiaceae bacterium]